MPDLENNDMECARCGGTFHIEETHCPHCGVSIYEPEDEQKPQNSAFTDIQDALRLPFAIFIGWFIAAFIGLLLYIPIRFALTEAPTITFVVILSTITLSIGGFSGGFLYQRISQQRSNFGNASLILFSVVIGIAIFLTEGSSLFLWQFFSILSLLLIGAASFMGVRLADKMMRQIMINDLFAPVVESQKRYLELLTKVGNDRDVAERLIEHERRFTPKATRNILVENAIKRWERDNRVQ